MSPRDPRCRAELQRTPGGWRLTIDGPPDATPDQLADTGRWLARRVLTPTVHDLAANHGYEVMVLRGPPDRPLRSWEDVTAEMERRLGRDLHERQVRRWGEHIRYATDAEQGVDDIEAALADSQAAAELEAIERSAEDSPR